MSEGRKESTDIFGVMWVSDRSNNPYTYVRGKLHTHRMYEPNTQELSVDDKRAVVAVLRELVRLMKQKSTPCGCDDCGSPKRLVDLTEDYIYKYLEEMAITMYGEGSEFHEFVKEWRE